MILLSYYYQFQYFGLHLLDFRFSFALALSIVDLIRQATERAANPW